MGNLQVQLDRLQALFGATEKRGEVTLGNPSDYPRLDERLKELYKLSSETGDVKYMEEDDSLCHIMDIERLGIYKKIAEVAKQKGAKRVIDIGCAFGHQSEVFLKEELTYLGVTNHESEFWNRDVFEYVVNSYPCELPVQKGDMAVSVLCLTWNIYLVEGEKTLREQCESLQRDFEHCLIYVQKNHVDVLKEYFNMSEHVEGNLYYFSNNEQKTHSF